MKHLMILVVVLAILFIASDEGFGFTDFKDGGMHNIDYAINDYVRVDYETPGMQTTLNVLKEGQINPPYGIEGYGDSRINISGGVVGYTLLGYDNCRVIMTDGVVNQVLGANNSSQVVLSGGSVDELFSAGGSSISISGGLMRGLFAIEGGQVTMTGGSVGEYLYATGVGQITMSGGSVDGYVFAYHSGQVNWTGGAIGGNLMLGDSANLIIKGYNFAIDGISVGFGEITSVLGGAWSLESSRKLTGTLANGDIINNQFFIGNQASLTLIPEPCTLLLLGVGGLLIRKR